MSEGFFDRWSRRKQAARVEPPASPAEPDALPPPLGEGRGGGDAPVVVVQAASPHPDLPPAGEGANAAAGDGSQPPPPTLADTASLTIDSDFKPFLARNVAPEVKNAAFKKLFADPHFNVMDRLDIYIDDYSIPSPLPESVLRQMASAKFLNLFDDEEDAEKAAAEGLKESPHESAAPDVAQSGAPGELPSPPVANLQQPASQDTDDHHADLRLQPDHAPRSESDREGAG
ncbi:MAG: DUF3306 domain-containing protein [Variovorax sp.]|nr:MAG: DUF3306 domain-containing protein [Variovorax sp.]